MQAEKYANLSPRKRVLVRLIDFGGSFLFRSHRSAISAGNSVAPKRILLVENWGIGDMVLATVALVAVKKRFPDSSISVLGKPHGKILLENCPCMNEYLTFTFPWTRLHGKYNLSNWSLTDIQQIIAELKKRDFDLVVSSRKDVRENLLLYLTGSAYRVSYGSNGGGFFLSDEVSGGNTGGIHRVDDWKDVLDHLGVTSTGIMPQLWLSADEIRWAEGTMKALAIDTRKPVIGIHVGASNANKRWPLERFEELVKMITETSHNQVLIFSEPDGYGADFKAKRAKVIRDITLRQLLALISECDLFVANDGGPMHIAAALQVPTVAIFGPTNPDWFGPWGDNHQVVFNTACRFFPCSEYCRFDSPLCIEGVKVEDVFSVLKTRLDSITK